MSCYPSAPLALAAIRSAVVLVALGACGGEPRWVLLARNVEDPSALEHFTNLPGLDQGRTVDGRSRVVLDHWAGDGWLIRSGLERTVSCDVPPRSSLDFFAAVSIPGGDDTGAELVLRVRAGDELLIDAPLGVEESEPRLRRYSLVLPAHVSGRSRLRFSLEGPPAVTAILAPVLRPAVVGDYASRPWGRDRPDLVLFLADTFRADNMSVYGGKENLTPNLDALASQSLVFTRAWSPAPWTAPAQAAMLTGRIPPHIDVDGSGKTLAPSVVTLAEHLGAAGYRTAAVTDSVYVSRSLGFDQGFELFDERYRRLEETQAAVDAFLDADDGRPVFLFVQTYRVHAPYRVSEETLERHGERLGIRLDWDAALAYRRTALLESGADRHRTTEERTRLLRSLYRGAVIDFDIWFDEFSGSLADRALLSGGYLVFTSDHGEAFGEHGKLWHKGCLWEEVVRIPLFIHGGALESRVVHHASSLTDLARTISHLCGVLPREEWDGTSLLGIDHERTLLVFERFLAYQGNIAAVRGPHKLLAIADADVLDSGEVVAAYDLGEDPGETLNLAGGEAWPAELACEIASETRLLLETQAAIVARVKGGAGSIQAVPRDIEQIEALGYAEGQ